MSKLAGKLILVRHGESTWNAKGVWTGTRDMHLTAKGKRESRMMGGLLRDVKVDMAYVSQQVRAKETLKGVLEAAGQAGVETHVNAALNERDYGEYTGMNKWEVKKQLGEEAFQGLRRGWDYPVPNGETLKDVYERTVPFFREIILPQLDADKTVMLVAHGNSIRSLIKYLETVSDEGIGEVEMIFGKILTYQVDEVGRAVERRERQIDSPPPPA